MSPELELLSGPPADISAERAILGSYLVDNPNADEANSLTESVFSLDSHRRIKRAIGSMQNCGIGVDFITLKERLAQGKELEAIGGAAYLASLTEGLPRRLRLAEYITIVCEKAALREIISVCERTKIRAADQNGDSALDIVTAADQELLGIMAESTVVEPSLEEQSESEFECMERQRNGEEIVAYSLGIPSLDRMIGGLVPREMTVLGARPGQGKTALKVQVIARHCPAGVPVSAFEIEMAAGQLLRRLWAIVSGVPFHKVRHPDRQTEDDRSMLLGAKRAVARWPLTIHDASTFDAAQIVSMARLGKRRRGTKIVVIDYLQRMRFAGRPDHRYLQVTDAAVQLARVAKEEDLAVLLLSSVSEKNGSHRNQPPTLQDFRQSGDIAFEAHCALLIHREVDNDTDKVLPDGEIIVAKARSDETGCVRVRFDSNALTFEEARG